MKANKTLKNSLLFKLFKNSKGTPYFSLKGETYLRINAIKNADDLLKLIKGAMYMLDTTGQGSLMFSFFSRGPLEWAMSLEKDKGKLTIKVFEVETEIEIVEEPEEKKTKKIQQYLTFYWTGKMEEFVQAVEILLVQSPYHKMGVLKKGTLG